jgi:hypothetical protein
MDSGCKGCMYNQKLSAGSGTYACFFLYYTGERRGCPPGAGCTRRDTGKLDPAKTFTMYRHGQQDGEKKHEESVEAT